MPRDLAFARSKTFQLSRELMVPVTVFAADKLWNPRRLPQAALEACLGHPKLGVRTSRDTQRGR